MAPCSWDHPGVDPYMGDMASAIDRYADIPVATRERLKARMARRDYDDMVTIRRDSIEGKQHYDPTIRDMHFGSGSVCRGVTRTSWSPQMLERGLVYCEGGECLLVPTVCRNVSRISRAAAAGPVASAGGGGAGGGAGVPAGAEELQFAPPAAGSTFEGQSSSPAVLAAGGVGGGDFVSTQSPLNSGVGGGTAPILAPVFPGIPGGFINVAPVISAVPEPANAALMLAGLAFLTAWRRRAAAAFEALRARANAA